MGSLLSTNLKQSENASELFIQGKNKFRMERRNLLDNPNKQHVLWRGYQQNGQPVNLKKSECGKGFQEAKPVYFIGTEPK